MPPVALCCPAALLEWYIQWRFYPFICWLIILFYYAVVSGRSPSLPERLSDASLLSK